LLIAGIVPGMLMSAAFVGYILIRCMIDPNLAPAYDVEEMTAKERWRPFLIYVMPLFSIFVVVVGSIFLGLASPSEAAALGCVASTVAAWVYGALTRENFMKSLRETAKVTTMVMLIIAASLTFSQVLAVSGATRGLLLEMQLMDLTALGTVLLMLAILLFLGAFMDQVSMLLLTLPFFLPMALTHNIDMLWLGVLILIVMEISLLTPPFGLLLYVMRGVAPKGVEMKDIYMAAFPFIGLEVMILLAILIFPTLAVWLPRLLE
ncbi:MAG: TRAP transporter large permease subunit, partial [Fimbriimonadaceae bacterium]|nr:TRAP transporter large permease subunit [Alphaproteobacteria bacterium]